MSEKLSFCNEKVVDKHLNTNYTKSVISRAHKMCKKTKEER